MTLAITIRVFFIVLLTVCVPTVGHSQPADLDLLHDLDGVGRRLVLEPCANPLAVKLQSVRNRHEPNVRDEVKLVTCPSFKAETYIAGADKPLSNLPLSLKVTAPVRLLPAQLQVGAPSANLKILGKPAASKGGAFTYVLPSEPGNDSITFATAKARISSIYWSWDVD